jgi:hypothetical protein
MHRSLNNLEETLNRLEDSYYNIVKNKLSKPKPENVARLLAAMTRIDPMATLDSATVTFTYLGIRRKITLKANGKCTMEWRRDGVDNVLKIYSSIEEAEALIQTAIRIGK